MSTRPNPSAAAILISHWWTPGHGGHRATGGGLHRPSRARSGSTQQSPVTHQAPPMRVAEVSETEPKGAWPRPIVALMLSTLGGSGFWSVVVVLPAIGSVFAVSRADASLTYAATMVGYSGGTLMMSRLADRTGITLPLLAGTLLLRLDYSAVGYAPGLPVLMSAQGLLVGVGSAAVYTPLVADVSHWFTRRRGMAISICQP